MWCIGVERLWAGSDGSGSGGGAWCRDVVGGGE